MYVLRTVLFIFSLLFLCEANYVDTLRKCSIKDDECLKSLYQNMIHYAGKPGIPELGIPPLDPLELNNITLPLLDTVVLTALKGSIKGISKCVFERFHLDMEKQTGKQEIVCDLTVKGQVRLSGTSPAIQVIIGSTTVDGQGLAKVKFGNLRIKYEAPFSLSKKDDGDIYLKIENKGIKFIYDVESAVFETKQIIIGNTDISQLVTTYLNGNWKMLVKSFGHLFVDKAMEIYLELANKFFAGVPTKNYLIEDMSSYVDN